MDDRNIVAAYLMGVYAERLHMTSNNPIGGLEISTIPIREVEDYFKQLFNFLSLIEDFAHEVYYG